MNSVNTNVGAMIALQSLNATTAELSTVQSRVNTGRKINNAKDNAAIWAIAQGQRGEVASYNAVKESLSRGQSAIDVAMSAGEAVADKLNRMKELALSASDANLAQTSRDAMQEEYRAAASEIRKYVQNASFNGVNLLDGSANFGYRALANSKGSATVDVAKEDIVFRTASGTAGSVTGNAAPTPVTQASSFVMRIDSTLPADNKTINVAQGDNATAIARKINDVFGKNVASVNNSGFLVVQSTSYGATSSVTFTGTGGTGDFAANNTALLGGTPTLVAGAAATGGATNGLEVTGNETFGSVQTTNYAALLKQLDDSIANVSKSVGRLGSGAKTMESTLSFVSKLQDTLEAGIGALVDADLAKESARLQALQTKQQLGVQALSIANQSTGILLGLFR